MCGAIYRKIVFVVGSITLREPEHACPTMHLGTDSNITQPIERKDNIKVKVKRNHSHYRPGQAQRVPGS